MLLFLTTLQWIIAAPGPVRNLSAVLERSSGEVLLTWLPPISGDNEITQYIIRYWRAGIGNCVDLVIPGPVFTQFENFQITSKRLGVSLFMAYGLVLNIVGINVRLNPQEKQKETG